MRLWYSIAPVWNSLAAMIKITIVVTVMIASPIMALEMLKMPNAFIVISRIGAVSGKYIIATTVGSVGALIAVLMKYRGTIINRMGMDKKLLASLAVGVAAPIATIMPLYIRMDTINKAAAIVIRTGSKVIIDRSMLGKSSQLAAIR